MASLRRAYKENRKLPFLKALARTGKIKPAARASRISRDAVYDWLRADPSFARAFLAAKRRHVDEEFQTLDSALTLFCDVVMPIIPKDLRPMVNAELAIAMTNLRHDLKEGGPRRTPAPSGNMPRVSLPLNRFAEVAVPNRGRDTFADL